ncbi:hypothetical protein [Streptomyces shenzhenensis]|uniref:hypothetical protein n=1 Tax=Streptomyces shenzhenensis TaxID=943815 RepID=UPI001F309158|nr:hypothetical protein [Streptomyces shenzhenensis]
MLQQVVDERQDRVGSVGGAEDVQVGPADERRCTVGAEERGVGVVEFLEPGGTGAEGDDVETQFGQTAASCRAEPASDVDLRDQLEAESDQ